mgnify:CR=1 FL=1
MRYPFHRPQNLPQYAEVCLQALADRGLGQAISLGGALGLMHYLDYRPTHDADAWWSPSTSEEVHQQVVAALQDALRPFGEVRTRSWGEVVSVELVQGGCVTFSFQIASRLAQLAPSSPAGWTDVLLDSLADLVASKMVALVERGAPRDFRDTYALCQASLVTPRQCWHLWQQRQEATGSDSDAVRARLAIEMHLARIALQRPLASIADPDKRAEAERVRYWFSEVFLHAQP